MHRSSSPQALAIGSAFRNWELGPLREDINDTLISNCAGLSHPKD